MTIGLCAALLGLGTSAEASAQTSALLIGGKGSYASLSDEQICSAFGGYFADYDNRVSITFPGSDDFALSTQIGADNLYAAVYSADYAGPKTIGGVSEGAPAVFEVLQRLEADQASGKTPPPPSELNVAVYAMPSGPFLGGYKVPQVVSPYDIIIVKAEYDGIADFPNNPFNLLAVVNALMGADQLHIKQANFDIRDQPTEYTIVTNTAGGTTTTILIPTTVLPLLTPMLDAGANPATVAKLDKLLRPIIDSAYKRPKMTYGIPDTLTGPPAPKPPITSDVEAPTTELVGGGTPATGTPLPVLQDTTPTTSARPPATALRKAVIHTKPAPTPTLTSGPDPVIHTHSITDDDPRPSGTTSNPPQSATNGASTAGNTESTTSSNSTSNGTGSHPDSDNGASGSGSSQGGGGNGD